MLDDSVSVDRLVGRLRGGEQDVLVELFSIYRQRLKRMVEFRMDARLRGRVDPSDILQEAYLDAAQRVEHFINKEELSFLVWLRQVTTQRMIDVHRRHLAQKRDANAELRLDRGTSLSLAAQLVGHLTSPSQLVMRAELLQQLEEALDAMDPIDREVLALRHFEELTNKEVSEILEITKAGASNRYVRALARLRTILESVPGFLDDIE